MSGTVLITGANRGIGLELVSQYAADGWQVFGSARDPAGASDLKKLAAEKAGQIRLLRIDVSDSATIADAAAEVGDTPIDVLINGAGVYGGARQRIDSMDYESWTDVLNVNTMGPLRVTEAFLGNVERSDRKLIAAITSGMGSLADNTSGGFIAYRTSKAGVNMVMRSLAVDLAPRGITCLVINPGWVKTRMGGPNAKITAEQSVHAMRKVFDAAGPKDSGKFFDYTGSEYPW